MNEIEILTAKEGDFGGINLVIKKHLSGPKLIYYKPSCLSEPTDVKKSDKEIYFIAKRKNKIIGYSHLHSREPFVHDDNSAEFEAKFEIVVTPEYRRKKGLKVGTKLLKYTIRHAKNKTKLKQLIAMIKEGNEASKGLCEKCGFALLCNGHKGFDMILKIVR